MTNAQIERKIRGKRREEKSEHKSYGYREKKDHTIYSN